jgi:hypothetical protein
MIETEVKRIPVPAQQPNFVTGFYIYTILNDGEPLTEQGQENSVAISTSFE